VKAKQERQIIFHGTHFTEFYIRQTAKVQEKIGFVFKLIKTVDHVPEKFLKHMAGTDGLYEVRVECESNIFRIFCCFDKGNLVILFNAFQKKSQKTPNQELALALKLKNEYFTQKEKVSKAEDRKFQRKK
jgi:phage-related protein